MWVVLIEYGMIEFDPIYNETAEKLNKLGIDGVLIDLDDTLIYTGEIFTRFMVEFSEKIAEVTDRTPEEVLGFLQAINDEEYKRMGVNPARWEAVLEQLAAHFPGHEGDVIGNLDILMKIYSTVPKLREGAKTLLQIFKASGVKVGLVTHANVDWTNFKLDSLGLWDFFDQIYIVDENGHKKSDDWKKAADGLKLETERCLFIGDSLSGDIRPGDELGGKTIWMPSPWAVYRQGSVPEKTVIINEIFGALAALDQLG